jgi:uncharacterized membrane protein YphA (DoxX/SURF4 family)
LFLVVLPPGGDRHGAVEPAPSTAALAISALRVCAGLPWSCWPSARSSPPALAREFIGNHPAFDLFGPPLGGDAFIRLAGAVELLFGLLLISGRIPQVAAIVAGIPFNATLFFLGRTELVGHLPSTGHARPAGLRLEPGVRRPGPVLALAGWTSGRAAW